MKEIKRNPAILNKKEKIMGLSITELFTGVSLLTIGRLFLSTPLILLIMLSLFLLKRLPLPLSLRKEAILQIKVKKC